jgi:hypothetical protein
MEKGETYFITGTVSADYRFLRALGKGDGLAVAGESPGSERFSHG